MTKRELTGVYSRNQIGVVMPVYADGKGIKKQHTWDSGQAKLCLMPDGGGSNPTPIVCGRAVTLVGIKPAMHNGSTMFAAGHEPGIGAHGITNTSKTRTQVATDMTVLGRGQNYLFAGITRIEDPGKDRHGQQQISRSDAKIAFASLGFDVTPCTARSHSGTFVGLGVLPFNQFFGNGKHVNYGVVSRILPPEQLINFQLMQPQSPSKRTTRTKTACPVKPAITAETLVELAAGVETAMNHLSGLRQLHLDKS